MVGQLVDCLHERKRSGAAVVSPFVLRSAFEQTEKSRTTSYIGLPGPISTSDVMDGPPSLALRRLYCHSA